jgi:hypothetical protein
MSRVEATFRARRFRVVTRSMEGKMENSRGELMNMVVRRMTREKEMLKESMRSRIMVGRGMSITNRIMTTPPARRMSPCLENRE